MNKVRFFDPAKSYFAHKEEFDSEMQRVLSAGDLILRKDVEKFEENLAKFVGTKYAVGLNSGTDAIYLAIKALGIKWGVAIPSHTFKSTCGAVIHAGAIPMMYDMDGNGVDETVIEAIIQVHIAGEVSRITNLEIPVIEDACQALGAAKNPTTSAQCWSFYPAKILGAFGDAGALTTNDEKIYEYVKDARNHFKRSNQDFGVNSRLDNLQAAILNVKFKYLPEILARRQEIADMYLEGLKCKKHCHGCEKCSACAELNNFNMVSSVASINKHIDLTGKVYGFKPHYVGLPNNQQGRVWQDFIIRVDKRDELYEFLKLQGIETMKNEYPFPAECPKLPLAAKYEAETLRLPINETIEDLEVEYIIKSIKKFYKAPAKQWRTTEIKSF